MSRNRYQYNVSETQFKTAADEELRTQGLRILARIIARAYQQEHQSLNVKTRDERIQQDSESDPKR